MNGRVLGFSFPNPFHLLGALISPLLDLGGELVGPIVEPIIEGLAGAVVGALVDLAAAVMGFFWTATEPELQSSWFHGSPDASYDQMVILAAPLLVVFFLVGVIQGVLRGDTAGMLRMALLRLPGAVLAMSLTVALGDVLLDVTDQMSATLLVGFRDDVEQVGVLLRAASLTGSLPAMMLELVFAGIGLLAAVVLVVELFVRAALIYLVAAFSPLIYAASVWESMRGSVRRLIEIGLALVVSKLAIAVALAVSASALVATWPANGGATAITTPEQAAAQADQPITQTVGVLVSAIVMFCVAAFMPFVLWRLLPVAEGAMLSHGLRGAPVRAAYLASSTGTMALNNPATALLRSNGKSGDAAVAAHPAVAAAAAGASAAKKGVKTATDRTARAADVQSRAASSGGRTSSGGRAASGSATSRSGSFGGRDDAGDGDGRSSPRPSSQRSQQLHHGGQASPAKRPPAGGGGRR